MECGTETPADIAEICFDNTDNDCDGDIDEDCTVEICGTVVAEGSLSPIEGASVKIAGGNAGNVIGGATTDAEGKYCVSGLATEFLTSGYWAIASAEGFLTETQSTDAGDFVVDADGNGVANFVLTPIAEGPACLEDNFEIDTGLWTATPSVAGASWVRRKNGPLANAAVGNCVTLPLGENCLPGPGCAVCPPPGTKNGCVPNPGALPNSWNGQYAYWFGNQASGNYLSNGGSCAANSGGIGVQVVGSLTSAPFALFDAGGKTSVRMRAWFEIESVDPQSPPTGYDEMRVEVVAQDGSVFLVGWLNPSVDQDGATNEPYSSGGYNTPGVWNLYQFDLTPFHGQEVQLRFTFNSDDGSYNGFRGWLLDDVAVVGEGCAAPKTALCGTVQGATPGGLVPVEGASVTIAGGTPGNVLFGTLSGPTGKYCIEDIPIEFLAAGGYFALAQADGFVSAAASTGAGDFAIVDKETTFYNFILPELGNKTTCFEDGFEIDVGDWDTSTGGDGVEWHRRQNTPLLNNAVGQCVVLSEEEATCGANPSCGICEKPTDPGCIPQAGALPNAWGGEYAYWFGNELNGTYTGSYLGQSGTCSAGSGGISGSAAVSGSLTSIPIPLPNFPGGTIALQFRAWFEIEATDPQKPPPLGIGHDGMYVEIMDGTGAVILGALNPSLDANGAASEPYGSGGFNKAPVWNAYEFDLTPFAGTAVGIRFRFNSIDSSYNAFRGWVVDDVKVIGEGCDAP